MSKSICPKPYCQQHSTLSLTGSQFIFLKCRGLVWDLGGNFRQKQIYLFWDFWSLCFKFFKKKETVRNIHNQKVGELAHYMKVLYTQGLGYNAICKSKVRGCVKKILIMSGINPAILKPHYTRSASSSQCKANWFIIIGYPYKRILVQEDYMRKAL